MLSALVVAASILFCVVADIFDVTMTQKGLKAGVAVEGFTMFVGEKPTARALYIRDGLFLAAFSAPSVWGVVTGNPALAIPMCIGPIIYAWKHILGGRAWKKLLTK